MMNWAAFSVDSAYAQRCTAILKAQAKTGGVKL